MAHAEPRLDADCAALLTRKYLVYERFDEIDRLAGTPHVTKAQFQELLVAAGLGESRLIQEALIQVQRSHATQARDNGASYLEQHIFPVTTSVIAELTSLSYLGSVPLEKVVAASLLHDSLEDDAALTIALFVERFGQDVYELVKPLTKPDYRAFPGADREAKKWSRDTVYVAALVRSPLEVRLIKLSDRLNNLISTRALYLERGAVAAEGYEKAVSYIMSTETFYLPLAREASVYHYLRLKAHVEALKKLVPDWPNERRAFLAKVGYNP